MQPGWNTPSDQWALAAAPRAVTGVGKATSVMAFVTGIAGLVMAFGEWRAYALAESFRHGREYSLRAVLDADYLDSELALLHVVSMIATAVLLMVWMYQARANAEDICTAQHRRSRGWVIGSWFCPVVNLWFPAVIMTDIYRASMPSTRHDQVSFADMPGVALVRWWWAAFLLSGVISYFVGSPSDTLDGLHVEFVGSALSALVLLVAAVPLTMIIRRVSAWQLVPKTA